MDVQSRHDEWAQRQRTHVFVLDAEKIMLDVMRLLLEDERYDVTTSTFLPRSFDQIAALQPTLLIIDLAVHRQVGWELLEQLAFDALTRGLPVIVTSTDPCLLARAEQNQVRYGGQSWIAKPFDIENLLAEVDRLLSSA